MTCPELWLGRGPMGAGFTEEAFDSWVDFASTQIENYTEGRLVSVLAKDAKNPDQSDAIVTDSAGRLLELRDCAERRLGSSFDYVEQARRTLWLEWCRLRAVSLFSRVEALRKHEWVNDHEMGNLVCPICYSEPLSSREEDLNIARKHRDKMIRENDSNWFNGPYVNVPNYPEAMFPVSRYGHSEDCTFGWAIHGSDL